jgi:hypothetical protein
MSDYPTAEDLEILKKLGHQVAPMPAELIGHLKEIWWNADTTMKYTQEGDSWTLELHTGGWSGNEEIYDALSGTLFYFMYWQKSTRGGHYYFEGERIKETVK